MYLLNTYSQFRERLEELVRRGAAHPKMEALLQTLLRHFAAPEGDISAAAEGGGEASGGGRVIIFTNLRESVHSIAEVLRQHSPVIEPRCAGACTRLRIVSSGHGGDAVNG